MQVLLFLDHLSSNTQKDKQSCKMDKVVNSAEMLPNSVGYTGPGRLHPSWVSLARKENILLSSWLRLLEQLCNTDTQRAILVGAKNGYGTQIIDCEMKMCLQHLIGGMFIQAFGFKVWFFHTNKE